LSQIDTTGDITGPANVAVIPHMVTKQKKTAATEADR
jgi:hypothetical protein